eukprot:3751632-Amphidinium_carterae.1
MGWGVVQKRNLFPSACSLHSGKPAAPAVHLQVHAKPLNPTREHPSVQPSSVRHDIANDDTKHAMLSRLHFVRWLAADQALQVVPCCPVLNAMDIRQVERLCKVVRNNKR